MNKPCEYCGCDLPLGIDKRTRQIRSRHFASCAKRPSKTEVAYTVDTSFNDDMLVSELRFCGDTISRHVVRLQDEGVRKALIALGWTPPGAKTPLTEAQIHDLKVQAMNNVPMARQRYIEFARLIERAHDIKEKP